MVLSEASGKGGKIRAILQRKAVDGALLGMPIAEDEEPAAGVTTILERKPDAGNPHVRFNYQDMDT